MKSHTYTIDQANILVVSDIEDAHILVIDDDATTVSFMTAALRHAGYRAVIGHTDPHIIMADWQHCPDLILLDLNMPVIDGFDLMEQLVRTDWPNGKPLVIVITSHEERELRLRALRLGAIDFINKPVDLRELFLRVRNHLTNRALQQQLIANEIRLNQLLKAAEQGSHAKDLFLANISHELRTPLTSIIGFAETLAEDHSLNAQQQDTMQIVVRNVRHLYALVSDLLDISKLQVGHLHVERTNVALFDCLKGVVQLIHGAATRKGLTFRFHPIPPLPSHIHTDPTRFKQILINLLNNAIKFTEKGEIYLLVSWDQSHCQLVLTVQDAGPGIPNDALPSIFDPFMQVESASNRHHGGSGLGLAIAKGLAEQLGGTIEVASVAGRGSVFIALIDTGPGAADCLLDSADDWQCSGEVAPETVPVPQLSGTVLVAEDTPDTQRLITLYLHRAGLRVIMAKNGEEVVQFAQQHADIALVLMDMHMPDMDGLEATHLLRLTGFDRPIVALTADVTTSTRKAALAAGCETVLIKPIDLHEFYALLAWILPAATAATHAPVTSNTSTPAAENDPEFAMLRTEFEQSLPARVAALRAAHVANDWETLRHLAHQLRGIGGSFGYPKVSQLAGVLETTATAGETAESEHFIQQLETVACLHLST